MTFDDFDTSNLPDWVNCAIHPLGTGWCVLINGLSATNKNPELAFAEVRDAFVKQCQYFIRVQKGDSYDLLFSGPKINLRAGTQYERFLYPDGPDFPVEYHTSVVDMDGVYTINLFDKRFPVLVMRKPLFFDT